MRSSPRRQLWAGSRDGISVQRKGWLRPAGALLCQCYVCTCVYVCIRVGIYVWFRMRIKLQCGVCSWKPELGCSGPYLGNVRESLKIVEPGKVWTQSHRWGASQAVNSCTIWGEMGSELGDNCSIVHGRDSEGLSSWEETKPLVGRNIIPSGCHYKKIMMTKAASNRSHPVTFSAEVLFLLSLSKCFHHSWESQDASWHQFPEF